MDLCILIDGKDDPFISAFRDNLGSIGKYVWLDRDTPFSDQLSKESESFGKEPIVLVIDIGKEKIRHWEKPMRDALQSRIFGGVKLPEGSSVVFFSQESKEAVQKLERDTFMWLCRFYDLHNSRYQKEASFYLKDELITPELISKMKAEHAPSYVKKISDDRKNPTLWTKFLESSKSSQVGLIEPDAILSEPLSKRVIHRIKKGLEGLGM